MKFEEISESVLGAFVVRQIDNFFPDQSTGQHEAITYCMHGALERLFFCLSAVRMWKQGEFNPLNTSQYATFLYFLSNEIWIKTGNTSVCGKLFALNKALNGIDLFYEINMPRRFFIGHSVGIVLAKASYGEYLVLYQNSTVGRHRERIPKVGNGVVIFPNCAIIGNSVIGDNTVVSQGTSVLDSDTPGDCIVEHGRDRKLEFRALRRRYAEEYFRLDD